MFENYFYKKLILIVLLDTQSKVIKDLILLKMVLKKKS